MNALLNIKPTLFICGIESCLLTFKLLFFIIIIIYVLIQRHIKT